jgi:hypothetical protein
MTRTEFDLWVFTSPTKFESPTLLIVYFLSLEQAVRNAIVEGIHPKMITKGSSGSYFARAKVDGRVSTVA